MALLKLILICTVFSVLCSGQTAVPGSIVSKYGEIPPAFEENHGQVDSRAIFFFAAVI